MPLEQKDGYLRFSHNVKAIKEAKEELRKQGYPKALVDDLVDQFMREPIGLPKNAVLLPVPSTSRTNTIPMVMSRRLSESNSGTRVITGAALCLNTTKAANKGALGKLRDPVRLKIPEALEIPVERPVFLVDDIVTTGETTDAMREALAGRGILVEGVISLGQSELRHSTATDWMRISDKLGSPHLGKEISDALKGRLKHRSNYIERIINDKTRSELRDYFIAESRRLDGLNQRTRDYLGNSAAMGSSIQLGRSSGTGFRR